MLFVPMERLAPQNWRDFDLLLNQRFRQIGKTLYFLVGVVGVEPTRS